MTLLAFNLNPENLALLGSALIIVAILVNKVGARVGLPFLLLALIVGVVAGPDVIGIHFDNYEKAKSIGHLAMTIILFTAGFETSFPKIKPIFWQGVVLSTVGVILTVLITGLFIYFVLGRPLMVSVSGAFLLAAILSSTDSASVFSILRTRRLRLREDLGNLLELESGSNDPMANTLTIILVSLAGNPSTYYMGAGPIITSALTVLVTQLVIGLAAGFILGYLAVLVIKYLRLPGGALYAILILCFGLLSSGLAEYFHGNGLLAIYVSAIIMGQMKMFPQKREVMHFFDGLTWLVQLIMFIMLGLLACPSMMLHSIVPSNCIGLFIMLVARPAGVLLSMLPFRNFSFRAKLFTSWVGLKGAGPILFAIYPIVAHIGGGVELFNIVFVITLMSLLIQGTTLRPFARLLRLSYDEDPVTETFGMEIPDEMGMLRDHTVSEEDLAGGNTLRDLHLPHGIRVMMVRRGGKFLVPHGSMTLVPGDKLIIIMGDSDD